MQRKVQMTTAAFLKYAMAHLNFLSQKQFGEAIGLSEDQTSRYINGQRRPSYDTCVMIQKRLAAMNFKVELGDIRGCDTKG